jgi:RND family efflux transporter MFP subunit
LAITLAAPAHAQNVTVSRIATGVVVPEREAVVAARIVGRIAELPLDEGDRVERGGLLVQLDDAEWQAELQGTVASLKLAEIEVQRKRKHQARIQDLRRQRSVSEDALDNAVFDLAAAKASLRIAEANVARVGATLAETRILAPFDAVVTDKSAELGEVTSPGSPLLTLQDQRHLLLRARVKEKDIPYLAVGQSIAVTIDALDDVKLEGTVSRIIPAGDTRTHTFEVEIDLPEQPGMFPGMFGKATF